ncbi:hypothetical protein ACJJTC_015891 [Scirpophaga incertulas]
MENDKENSPNKRRLSESNTSAESSNSSDEESGGSVKSGLPPKKRARHVSDLKLEFLFQQVNFLTSLITQSQVNHHNVCDKSKPSSAVTSEVKNTDSVDGLILQPPPGTCTEKALLNIPNSTVVVKDPLYPISNDKRLKALGELQRFNTGEWLSIRFAEAQKKYLSTPGFVELNINEEIKRFESPNNEDYRLYLLERSFAAMTNAMLIQKEELRNNLQDLINWSGDKETELTPSSLFKKVEQLFDKHSNFTKVSDDLLQIVCGRRSDLIRLRRDSLLKQIPDEYISASLEKNTSEQSSSKGSSILNSYPEDNRGGPSSSGGHRGMVPAYNQTKEKTFRSRGSQRKGKPNQSNKNKNKCGRQKPKQTKDKPTRSRSPPKYRNSRL